MARTNSSSRAIIDLTGMTFGRLTVIGLHRREPAKRGTKLYWLCRCECGKQTTPRGDQLRCGDSRSCGCVANVTHGKRHTREYRIWVGIKHRCFNPNDAHFDRYGGRGITICDEWRNSFGAFFAYVGECPSPRHTIDRYPNNDGNYEPGNVRWATRVQQNRNVSSNRLIYFRGANRPLAEVAEIIGIPRNTLGKRLAAGWSLDRAVSEPIHCEKSHRRCR